MQELNSLVQPLLQLVRDAGARIMQVYQTDFEVQAKQDQSPVTAADMAAHALITKELPSLTPGIPVLSEESGVPPFEQRRRWGRYWLVDPLDGTKEFIKKNGEFTVNIALIDNHLPVLGVVGVPAQSREYYGGQGLGAFRVCQSGTPEPIHVSPLGPGPVRVVGSRSHPSPALGGYLARLGAHHMVPMGSSLKLCLVAEGKADIYPRLGPTSEWDTAAAHAVVLGAGGSVTDLSGRPLRYNTKDDILNPHFLVFADATRDWVGYL